MEYLNCGLLEHGAARVYCDGCQHSFLVAFSCKKRGICPSCSAKRAVKFAEHLSSEILKDVAHRHVVFSVPKRIRPFFRYDRSLCDILFLSAWRSIKECLSGAGEQAALVLTLQTAGEALNYNPHLHGILSDGVFLQDGNFRRFEQIDVEAINARFGELVLSEFSKRDLITEGVMSEVLSHSHTGFSAWLGEPFADEESEKFVARYVERGPLSLEKLSVVDDLVVYTTKDGSVHEFEVTEFLALLSSHIPSTYESVTRFYGGYSSRIRGERAKAEKQERSEEELVPEPLSPASSNWASSIKRIYEVNPLECPRCKGEMRIVAFLHDPVEIKKIMKSQGIADFRPPPALPDPPVWEDHEFIDDVPDYDA